MTKYLFLLVLIWAGDLWAQKNIEPISPRYIFVEKDNGEYEYHEISHFYESGSYSPKIKNQKLMLYGDSYCLIINDFKHLTLKRHLKNELNQPFALHGYVVKKSDVKHIVKKNPAPRYACPNETTANKVQIKPGISKSTFDKLQEKEKLSQADLKETVSAKVYHDKADPYHKVCDEISDLKKMIQSLQDNGYLDIKMKTKDKTLVIPIHTGVGAPYLFTKNYKLHEDHKIPYYRRDVEMDLSDKAKKLIVEAETIIQEQEARENELLLKQFEEILGESITGPMATSESDQEKALYYQGESKYKKPPGWSYLLLPLTKEQRTLYLKLLKNGGKWLGRAAAELVIAELVLGLFVSATDPNEIEKSIIENPFNLIATMDPDEEKRACRRILYHPEAYQALYSLLYEIESYYFQLRDYEALMQYKDAFEVYDEERTIGKDGIKKTTPKNQTNVIQY